jgi:hypothetical protein
MNLDLNIQHSTTPSSAANGINFEIFSRINVPQEFRPAN